MKKIWIALSLLSLVIATAVAQQNANMGVRKQGEIKVLVDNKMVDFPDQEPMMTGNRVLVPLRGVFEQMGASVQWLRAENKVVAKHNGKTVELMLGETQATVDGRQLTLDEPARVVNGRAMVPLRFLSESLGATVDWRATTMTVTIDTSR